MHLPDGFLTPAVWAPAALLSTAAVAAASRRAPSNAPGATASLAAFVFAAQTLQFPIPGGASGHLLGGTLLSILLGVPRAVAAMAAVFVTQAVLFQDGGITTLGANILNGGIVPAAVGAAIYSFLSRAGGTRAKFAAPAIAGFVATLCGAFLCSIEVALSGTATFATFTGAMMGVHLWIALAEGVITASIVRFLASRPELFLTSEYEPANGSATAASARPWIWILAILTILGASVLWSSTAPDGLEHAAARLGLLTNASAQPAAAASGTVAFFAAAGGAAAASCAFFLLLQIRWKRGR